MHDKISGLPGEKEKLLQFLEEFLELIARASFLAACKFNVPYKPFGIVAKLMKINF